MGTYLNPTTEAEKVGREIVGHSYAELQSQLTPDEKLVGVFDNGVWKAAPHLYSEREYQEFEAAYNGGNWVRRRFIAVKSDDFQRLAS